MKQAADCIIIGGGPAGLQAAGRLAQAGYHATVLEKEETVGGKLNKWDKLFPDFYDAKKLKKQLEDDCASPDVTLLTGAEAVKVEPEGSMWKVTVKDGRTLSAPSVLLCTGFEPFDATRKEEYGYGIYPDVISSVELEAMIGKGEIKTRDGRTPQSVAYIQCVGSRDEKTGNHYCSVNCCICAVKQCIEVKELLPEANQYCFYMDLRMTGQHFEERYRESQEKYNVHFIRGRVSETALTQDGRIQVKAEDTLLSRPVKMTVDLLVLMVGMEASQGTRKLSEMCHICGEYGFAQSLDPHLNDCRTAGRTLFVAGTCKRPMTLTDAVNDGRSAACEILTSL